MDLTVQGKGSILNGSMFIFPTGEKMSSEDLRGLVEANERFAHRYRENRDLYLGDHPILTRKKRSIGPDNRLVADIPKYIVETFNGYFMGIAPKITLDQDESNKALQNWNDINSFQDKLNEISKQSDLYGRSIAFLFQNEDSETKIAYCSPDTAFIVYDDTVGHNPLAFVRYAFDENEQISGSVCYDDEYFNFSNNYAIGIDGKINQFGTVPAVEFFNNEERQGVFDPAKTLIEELDDTLSQKANQNEYFDNAYLKILGLDLDYNDDGEPDIDLTDNPMIYSPGEESVNGVVEFITKPDNDTMQENLIDRLTSLIYQTTMVANLNDEAFSGNSSGVALQYKLLPMKNMAASKERKFTQALRKLYSIVFGIETIKGIKSDDWSNLSFQFTRNLPVNFADEASTAQSLNGIVSKETQLSTLSFIDDPKAEIKRINDESDEQIKRSVANVANATDNQKVADEDGEEE